IRDRNVTGVQTCALPIFEEKLARYGGPLQAPSPGFDPETLSRPVLEAPTAVELAGAGRIDPIDLEIFEHKLDAIIDEGRDVFMRSEERRVGKECRSWASS